MLEIVNTFGAPEKSTNRDEKYSSHAIGSLIADQGPIRKPECGE
jgi:hypothetical protein